MKMRHKRKMRTRPRDWVCAASIKCDPYVVTVNGCEIPMSTRRVKFRFQMQSANHSDYMRKIRVLAEAQRKPIGEKQ